MSTSLFGPMSLAIARSRLGVDGTFTAAGGSAVAVRLVPSRPEEAFGGLDAPRAQAVHAVAMLPAAAVPARPQRGDALIFGGQAYLVAEVLQDPRGASYTLHLRRAPPPVTP